MDAFNIVKYIIVFYICNILNWFSIAKLIVYCIGILSATLLILNMAFFFFLCIAKNLMVVGGHSRIMRPSALKLLVNAYILTAFIVVILISVLYKLLLYTAGFQFCPLKLLDAMAGSHSYHRIMTFINLINLCMEMPLLQWAPRIALWFHGQIRGILRLQLVDSSIPRLRYGELCEEEKKNGECVICLESFRNEDLVRVPRECKHCYHVKCIDEWLREHLTCPTCRANMLPSEFS